MLPVASRYGARRDIGGGESRRVATVNERYFAWDAAHPAELQSHFLLSSAATGAKAIGRAMWEAPWRTVTSGRNAPSSHAEQRRSQPAMATRDATIVCEEGRLVAACERELARLETGEQDTIAIDLHELIKE